MFLIRRLGGHAPRVEEGRAVLIVAREPALLADLNAEGVQLAVGDGGGEEVVLATLVAVSGAGEQLVLVVVLAVAVGHLLVEQVGHRGLPAAESALGQGVALPRLLAQQVCLLLEELVEGAKVLQLEKGGERERKRVSESQSTRRV